MTKCLTEDILCGIYSLILPFIYQIDKFFCRHNIEKEEKIRLGKFQHHKNYSKVNPNSWCYCPGVSWECLRKINEKFLRETIKR